VLLNYKETINKTKDKRMYQRYMVILYHLKGYINIDISNMVDLCRHTVGTYVNKYKENGLLVFLPPYSPKLNMIEGLGDG
jgi:transposase